MFLVPITVKAEVVYHVKSEDFLRIDFRDFRTFLCYLPTSDSNVASVGRSVGRIAIGVPYLGNHNE